MEIIFDFKKSMAELAQFDQASADSAQNLNTNFSTQLAALSNVLQETAATAAASFDAAFLEIDAVAAASAANIETAFAAAAATMDEIFGTAAQTMEAGFEETAVNITSLFETTFAEIDAVSIDSALLMSETIGNSVLEITTGLQELQLIGVEAFIALLDAATMYAETSAAVYADAAVIISDTFTATTQVITENLAELNIAYEESALLMTESFGNAAVETESALAQLQAVGSGEFAVLSDNATNLFTAAADSIFTNSMFICDTLTFLQSFGTEAFWIFSDNAVNSFIALEDYIWNGAIGLSDIINGTSLNMEISMKAAFQNIVKAFASSLASMSAESNTQFGKIKATGDTTGNALAAKFKETGTSIVNSLKSAFSNTEENLASSLADMLEESNTQFGEIKLTGQNTAKDIKKSYEDALSDIEDKLDGTKNIADGILNEIENICITTTQKMQLEFSGATIDINQNLEDIGQKATTTNDSSTTAFKELMKAINVDIDSLSQLNTVYDAFKNAVEIANVITAAGTAANAANTASTVAKTGATTAAGAASTGAAVGFLAAGAGVLAMGLGIALAVSAIVLLLMVLGASVAAAASGIGNLISSFKTPAQPKFCADGGFVSTGQMFVAREAGPELVGTIGSRTAVANNDQIVESVSAGVYRAVREAMSVRGTGSNSPLEVNLHLDGKQITSAVERVQRERGLSLMSGTAAYGF